jgi:16S rRNA processing protein RimM
MMSQPAQIFLGKINGLYGIQGWVKVFSYTDPLTNIFNYSSWQLCQQGRWQTVAVHEGQVQGRGLIARLAGCHTRDEAARFIGAEIAVDRAQLPPLAEGEYYWADLLGLKVFNQQGVFLGEVDYLLETGAHDVLVLKGETERLIPFVLEHIVLAVDLTQKILRVDWDEDF